MVLNDSSLLNLTDIERKVLQKVAIAKLQALNLGVNVKIPSGKFPQICLISIKINSNCF